MFYSVHVILLAHFLITSFQALTHQHHNEHYQTTPLVKISYPNEKPIRKQIEITLGHLVLLFCHSLLMPLSCSVYDVQNNSNPSGIGWHRHSRNLIVFSWRHVVITACLIGWWVWCWQLGTQCHDINRDIVYYQVGKTLWNIPSFDILHLIYMQNWFSISNITIIVM